MNDDVSGQIWGGEWGGTWGCNRVHFTRQRALDTYGLLLRASYAPLRRQRLFLGAEGLLRCHPKVQGVRMAAGCAPDDTI